MPASSAADSGNAYKINYDGGSSPHAKAGTDMKLFITKTIKTRRWGEKARLSDAPFFNNGNDHFCSAEQK